MSRTTLQLNTTDAVKQGLILTLSGVVPYLIGPPGIGKTETVKSIENKNELIFTDDIKKFIENKLNKKFDDIKIAVKSTELHTMPEEYLSGLADYSKDRKSTVWTIPEIVNDLNELAKENDIVIWFVDDIHRASKTKQDYFFELETHRSIHGHKLEDNVFIMAAGNDSSAAGRVKMLTPIVSRFCFIRITLTPEDWIRDYAIRNNVHPLVISFLSQEENVRHFMTNESQEPFSTPRTWVKVSNYLKSIEEIYGIQIQEIPKKNPILMKHVASVISGLIHYESAADFIKYIATLSKINIKDILENPEKFDEIAKSIPKSLIFIHFMSAYIYEITIKNKLTEKDIDNINNLLMKIIENNPLFGTILVSSLLENVKTMLRGKGQLEKIKDIFKKDLIMKLRRV